jgi:hypothetical protein
MKSKNKQAQGIHSGAQMSYDSSDNQRFFS